MIAGDTIVIKPHEMTPLSALHMAVHFEEAGVPSGVVSFVTGDGPSVGAALAACDDVALISMTGSVRAGKQIMRSAADNLTQLSLELGGKGPIHCARGCRSRSRGTQCRYVTVHELRAGLYLQRAHARCATTI